LKKVHEDKDLNSATLFGLMDTGTYPVLPAREASRLAFEFEKTPYFLFLRGFGFGPMDAEDLRRVYLASWGLPKNSRYGVYQYLSGRLGSEMGHYHPRGVDPIWRLGHIDQEQGIRAKLDAYFGIPSDVRP